MAINIKDVEHAANLARLRFSEDQMEDFTKKFSGIIEYVEKLNEVDVEGVEPTYHILPLKNVLREDEVKPSIPREKVLMNAPEQYNGYFKLPKVIE